MQCLCDAFDSTSAGGERRLGVLLCRFVDRDMFMRFVGGGVGHKGLRSALASVLEATRLAFCGEAEAIDADDEGLELEGGAISPQADVGAPSTLEELLPEGMQADAEAPEVDDEGYLSNEEDRVDEDDEEAVILEESGLRPGDGEEDFEDPFQAARYALL